MEDTNTVIAVFADHPAAETAIKKLTSAGFDMKNLSVVGKGYHTDEKVVGFYNTGYRIKFWGTRGAFWGGFWGLFLGGLFMTVPVVGHVVVLGYLASIAIAGVENAVVVGGMDRLWTAALGGFAIGFVTSAFAGWLPSSGSWPFTSGVYIDSVVFGLVILALLLRPDGLFTRRRHRAVERV